MSWLTRLTTLVNQRLGIRLSLEGREDTFRQAVNVRAAALGLTTPEEYVARVSRTGGSEEEFQSLVLLVTNGHTSFFRDLEQLMMWRQVLTQDAPTRRLQVWCAGCSTGEEAYTIAMLCKELGLAVEVLGTDINKASLTIAQHAQYDPWTTRRIPEEYARFLVSAGEQLRVADSVRASVRFQQHNLLHNPPRPAPGQKWDVIFCRNVFIYFPLEEVGHVARWFASALAPDGHLLIGASERLPDLKRWVIQSKGSRHTYQLAAMNDEESHQTEWSLASQLETPRSSPADAPPLSSVAPFLDAPPPLDLRAAPATAMTPPSDEDVEAFSQVNVLIEAKSNHLAVVDVRKFLDAHPNHVPALLTLGCLELAQHRFDDALAAFGAAADADPFLPDTYLFQGITHRKLGNLETARQSLQRALFLAPEFWPASFMLIGVYERLGQHKELTRELRRTLGVLNGGQDTEHLSPGVHRLFYPRADEVREACLIYAEKGAQF